MICVAKTIAWARDWLGHDSQFCIVRRHGHDKKNQFMATRQLKCVAEAKKTNFVFFQSPTSNVSVPRSLRAHNKTERGEPTDNKWILFVHAAV